jgi:hypothetical protein
MRLPVTSMEVGLRLPDGADELALIEADTDPLRAALCLIERLVSPGDGGSTTEWRALPVTDFEVLLLRLRERLLGPGIESDVACPACRERVTMSFTISEYLAGIRPVMPRYVAPAERTGWFQLCGPRHQGVTFRLPTVADLLAITNDVAPEAALCARSVAGKTDASGRRRVEHALSCLAPPVTGEVGGSCPACGVELQALFDVVGFVVAEFRKVMAGLYREVHLIAACYGWTETAILSLPGPRRRRYAALVSSDLLRQATA